MKSGIVTTRDPYLMDPSLLVVDPNLVLDYGSSFIKDDSLFCNSVDPLMDLINCDDTQLENIILNSNFCDNPWAENEFEDLLKDIVLNQVQPSEPIAENVVDSDLSSTVLCAINDDTEVANYEEVSACYDESESVTSDNTTTTTEPMETIDMESVQSYSTQSSTPTRKRNLSDISTASSCASNDTIVTAPKPKRRKARRTKRVQDDRVKDQNKVAAMKYRHKKKVEKDSLEDILGMEEEKNGKLKASVEELQVNIEVLKELLGKYLSPSQLQANSN
jgi:hypothetical protein